MVSPPDVGWFRRIFNRCMDATGLRAPLGYEDETGFHYGSIPMGEQQRIARRNMADGAEPPEANRPTARKQSEFLL